MEKLEATITHRIAGMEAYAQKADYLETVEEVLTATDQRNEQTANFISEQWDKINKEFMERSVAVRALQTV